MTIICQLEYFSYIWNNIKHMSKMTEAKIPNFYTIKEAQEPLKMSRGTIYRKAKEGALKLDRDAGGRHIVFKDEIVRYLNGKRNG